MNILFWIKRRGKKARIISKLISFLNWKTFNFIWMSLDSLIFDVQRKNIFKLEQLLFDNGNFFFFWEKNAIQLQRKPFNVIMVNVISCLLYIHYILRSNLLHILYENNPLQPVFIQLMKTVFTRPKVITLSGCRCVI